MAQGADPEGAPKIADIGDDMVALWRWRHPPLARGHPPHTVLTPDDHRRVAARRNTATRPDITVGIGAHGGGDVIGWSVKAEKVTDGLISLGPRLT